ncbi:hypothetical protein BT93_I0090 [Corymbia citriodora subsp. variegata]|nr:hypothetical protein BT93_I0090 [Corymbia citriodora subsp. variegata]
MAPPPPYPPYPYMYPSYSYAAPPYPYPPPKPLVCSKAAPPPPPNWHWRPSSKGGWVPHVCCHDKPPQGTQVEDILIEVRRFHIEPEPETRTIRYIRFDV